LEQSFTARIPLLTAATSSFVLDRRRWSSPRLDSAIYYLHSLTALSHHMTTNTKVKKKKFLNAEQWPDEII